MNIVYALTRNYYERLVPSYTSLMEWNPKAKVFVLAEDDDIGLPVTVINVSGQTTFPKNGPNYNNQFTYINLLKVCYPSLLPCNKVIHLDVDTVVCDSLEPLWKINVTGKWLAAVPERNGWYKPFGKTYYNMGVALINLAQLRKDHAEEEMVRYLNTVRQPWADQDAWNRNLDKVVEAPVRFNENRMTGETANPAIVHYCSIGNWWTNYTMHRREYLNKYIPPFGKK